MNMPGWSYIALTALLAWAWGNYQYGKGWKDCQCGLVALMEGLRNGKVRIITGECDGDDDGLDDMGLDDDTDGEEQ